MRRLKRNMRSAVRVIATRPRAPMRARRSRVSSESSFAWAAFTARDLPSAPSISPIEAPATAFHSVGAIRSLAPGRVARILSSVAVKFLSAGTPAPA